MNGKATIYLAHTFREVEIAMGRDGSLTCGGVVLVDVPERTAINTTHHYSDVKFI